jgi:hypothetical protein
VALLALEYQAPLAALGYIHRWKQLLQLRLVAQAEQTVATWLPARYGEGGGGGYTRQSGVPQSTEIGTKKQKNATLRTTPDKKENVYCNVLIFLLLNSSSNDPSEM